MNKNNQIPLINFTTSYTDFPVKQLTGMGLKHEAIQNLLDQCLLNDKEMKQGPEKLEEELADQDPIKLVLDEEKEGDEGEMEEGNC